MNLATFDIEADNLYDDVTTIHCIVIKPYHQDPILYEPMEIKDGVNKLLEFDKLVAHNGIDYDARVIKKLYGVDVSDKVLDTMLLSKLHDATLPKHSLDFLGTYFNLSETKADYNGGWDVYTDEMGEYCIQDVRTNEKLFDRLKDLVDINASYVELEHITRKIQSEAATHGVLFNMELAKDTLDEINTKMEEIRNSIQLGYSYTERSYKPKKDGGMTTACLNLIEKIKDEMGVDPDVAKKKVKQQKTVQGKQIGIKNDKPVYAKRKVWEIEDKWVVSVPKEITLDTQKELKAKLLEMGWEPTYHTPKGNPKLVQDGEVCPNLLSLGGEFKKVGDYQMLKHRKGLIEGLIDVVRPDGRIPSEADTLGAVTHRYTHKKIANFPRVSTPYGERVREMFTVPEGKVQIGADLAGLELRMLAHYMNDEDYTKEVLEGDIHTANQEAAELPTRDDAKTFIYGFLYGAGDEKVGNIIGRGKEDGARIKRKFLSKFPALEELIYNKQIEAKSGYVTSIDGRKIRITKAINKFTGNQEYQTHKALNSVLQSSGAIFAKTWVRYTYEYLTKHDINATITINYHDESQIEVADNEHDIEVTKQALRYGVKKADEELNTNCPNDIDIKVGRNWKDCH